MTGVVGSQSRPIQWGTYFATICENEGLFGLSRRQYSTAVKLQLRVGSFVELVDWLYGEAGVDSSRRHRICGPFEVISPEPLKDGERREYPDAGPVVIFRVSQPSIGPWLADPASKFGYFPRRFRMRRLNSHRERLEPCRLPESCSLCKPTSIRES